MKSVPFVLKYPPYLISFQYILPDTVSQSAMQLKHRPMVLIILDGWGYSETTAYNAIHSARKPVWDHLWDNCPRTLLNASGMDVGTARQTDGQLGNGPHEISDRDASLTRSSPASPRR